MGKVVYRKEKKSRFPYPLLILGAVVVFGFSLVNLVFPKRDQLELENRKAAQLPAFSVSALLDGSWQSGFARWMQDQFALRDVWVNTQRAADEIVFQKVEEGGILLGNGPGVDDNIWLFGPGRTVVDALGEKALAGAVFADEGHRVLHFRQRFALRHHPPDDGGGAEDVFPLVMGKKFPGAVHFLAAGVIRL